MQAVDRALSLLDAFPFDGGALELRQIAERTGLYKSTILRLAASLSAAGLLERDADGLFRLGPRLAQLGLQYQRGLGMHERIRDALRQLSAETGESASFYVRDGARRLCLLRENSSQSVRHHLDEGVSLPLGLGAAGKVLSAFAGMHGEAMDGIRRRGWAESVGERDPLVAAVAAPVFDSSGRCIGALAVSGLIQRLDAAARRRHARMLIRFATELGAPRQR